MRILIVKLGAIGDVVHAMPALSALRRSMSGAHLAWAVERGGAAKLLQGCASLDELIELDMRGWRKSLMNVETQTAIRKAMAGLRNGRFDLSLDFQGLHEVGDGRPPGASSATDRVRPRGFARTRQRIYADRARRG